MTRKGFDSYEGNEPYIFISYSRSDVDRVLPILEELYAMGYRIWYDAGIQTSSKWIGTIVEHVEASAQVIIFISPAAITSDWVLTEVSVARDNRIPIAPIYLEPTKLNADFKGLLQIFQSIFYYEYPDVSHFLNKLILGIPEKTKKTADIASENYKAGQELMFGNILWVVIKTERDKVLLITKDITSFREYNGERGDVAWEKSAIRAYLNSEFLLQHFSSGEVKKIAKTELINGGNSKFGIAGSNKTSDMVFLLSIEELCEWFPDNASRVCRYNGEPRWWWLRSPGEDARYFTANVNYDGTIKYEGGYIRATDGGVRPAIWMTTEQFPEKKSAQFLKQTGGTVRFGRYKWLILDVCVDKTMLISKDILFLREFEDTASEADWLNCSLRKFLNDDFIYDCFSAEERQKIIESNIIIKPNPKFGKLSYIDSETSDKVFLLDVEAAEKFFNDNASRIATHEGKPYWWWLRTQGYNSGLAVIVRSDGQLSLGGDSVKRREVGVRPVIYTRRH